MCCGTLSNGACSSEGLLQHAAGDLVTTSDHGLLDKHAGEQTEPEDSDYTH